MENVKDWCISRQLWWGHRIPVYYLEDGGFVVAETAEKALELAKIKTGNANLKIENLRQDEDVLDTWASSWLWPISVFNGFKDEKEIAYYYPTNDLVTAPEIIFFWVARMIIAGYEYRGDLPFKNVYFTGIVRDKIGRKMSKSLGNSPDPLDLIAQYGADGVRVGMLLSSPAGNDLPFDESLVEQGRNFSNKIWNAFRLVKNWEVSNTIEQPESAKLAVEWYEAKLNQTIALMDDHFAKFRISEALMTIYTVFWQEFSGWYLEAIKPGYQQPIDAKTYQKTLEFFDRMLKLLHPFMPFITEEIWQALEPRKDGESIMVELLPTIEPINDALLDKFELCKEAISGIRTIRKDKNIPQKDAISLLVLDTENCFDTHFNAVIVKLGNLNGIETTNQKVDGALSFLIKSAEFFVPMEGKIDVEAELARLKEELAYNQGFLDSVRKKLSNEKFVASAPEKVVAIERQKEADAISKIQVIEETIKSLSK